jgi:fatty-acyl-CoA synthase
VGPQPADEPGVLDFDRELARQPADRLVSGRVIEPHEICSYFHTGGTTGSPKLAQHTHGGEVYMAWVLTELADLGVEDALLMGLPLFHVNAVMVTGLAPFLAGSRTVMLSPAPRRRQPVTPRRGSRRRPPRSHARPLPSLRRNPCPSPRDGVTRVAVP